MRFCFALREARLYVWSVSGVWVLYIVCWVWGLGFGDWWCRDFRIFFCVGGVPWRGVGAVCFYQTNGSVSNIYLLHIIIHTFFVYLHVIYYPLALAAARDFVVVVVVVFIIIIN
jgi:hypothetical protein